MIAYLIDPFERKVTEVEYSGQYQDIYKLIDAQTFDVARLRNGDSIFIDDEGLMKSNEFFMHRGYYNPLAGKGLVLGTDEEGDSVSPSCTLDQLIEDVEFGLPLNVGGKIIWVSDNR